MKTMNYNYLTVNVQKTSRFRMVGVFNFVYFIRRKFMTCTGHVVATPITVTAQSEA